MEYEWDEAKHKKNITKHGVDFTSMAGFDWETSITARDIRREYGETRYVSYGLIGLRLYACVYTQRNNKRRIISLRKANEKEEEIYENTFSHD